ncbi:receptor-type tyrosine-protein phosphatase alpha-like [Ptychodera flava]|uniref:receptor-type tyrosine-protein phosphatase alpha-like n=1 Tax=Ptychodera flava TaxID=63121 RepID=UPI003969EB52
MLHFDPFIIEVKSTEVYDAMNVRTILLTHSAKTGPGAVREITQIQVNWPAAQDIPPSVSVMIDLIGLVERAQQQSGDNVITVHCSNGIGRSGVFCALFAVFERIKVEHTVDVFQAVKMLRNSRPGMVETLAQYQYCYDVSLCYLDSFLEYSNFESSKQTVNLDPMYDAV